mgnify:CR=1 FL=1
MFISTLPTIPKATVVCAYFNLSLIVGYAKFEQVTNKLSYIISKQANRANAQCIKYTACMSCKKQRCSLFFIVQGQILNNKLASVDQ